MEVEQDIAKNKHKQHEKTNGDLRKRADELGEMLKNNQTLTIGLLLTSAFLTIIVLVMSQRQGSPSSLEYWAALSFSAIFAFVLLMLFVAIIAQALRFIFRIFGAELFQYYEISDEDELFFDVYTCYEQIKGFYGGKSKKITLSSIEKSLKHIVKEIREIAEDLDYSYVSESRRKLEFLATLLEQGIYPSVKRKSNSNEVNEFFENILIHFADGNLNFEISKTDLILDSSSTFRRDFLQLIKINYQKIPIFIRFVLLGAFFAFFSFYIINVIGIVSQDSLDYTGVVALASFGFLISGGIHYKKWLN